MTNRNTQLHLLTAWLYSVHKKEATDIDVVCSTYGCNTICHATNEQNVVVTSQLQLENDRMSHGIPHDPVTTFVTPEMSL